MAEPSTAALNPGTPQAALVDTTTLPSTPTSLVSSANVPTLAENSNFLKPTSPRKRRRSPESSGRSSLAGEVLRKSSGPTSPKLGLSPRPSPIPLTAAAELIEQKRRREMIEKEQASQKSPNPVKAVLGVLVGDRGMSKPQDAPAPATTLNEAVAAIAPTISIPTTTQGDSSMQISPVSMSSFGTLDSTAGGGTITANGPQVASPGGMGEDTNAQRESPQGTSLRPEEGDAPSSKAMSFPGPLLTAQPADARRGMSLPSPALDLSNVSGNRKHKCPYCATEFTRHHNLKSHLLTHSHEKPYMCQTCDSRFRRLHDLKRHTKLHTGERPHVCPKCKRSFARGDALARHNKGQGGCAGRRSSAGSYGDNAYDLDAPGEEGMDGLVYTGEASQEPDNMDDDGEEPDDRRKSLPSIRRHEAPDPHYRQSQEGQSGYQRQPSTYPPVAARQSTGGGLQPPSGGHVGGSSPATSPGSQSTSMNAYVQGSGGAFSNANVFSQTSMTESPKPLSPGTLNPHSSFPDPNIRRNRSPSLTQQFQQQQYGRRTHSHPTPPPAVALGPPANPTSHSNAPHLPSLAGLNPPDPRYTLHSQGSVPTAGPHGPPQTLPSQPQAQTSGPHPPSTANTQSSYHTHSQQGSTSSILGAGPPLSSHSNSLGSSHAGSGERANLPFPTGEQRLWAYVQSLEARIERLSGEVERLHGIVAATASANAAATASRAGSIAGPSDTTGQAAVANMTPSTNTSTNVNTSGNVSGDSNISAALDTRNR